MWKWNISETFTHYSTVSGAILCCVSAYLLVCQVVGIEDFRMGEEVCACITLVEGQDCTAEEIRDYCKGKVRRSSRFHIRHLAGITSRTLISFLCTCCFQIAHFNIPRYVLFFTSYPLTPSGKVISRICLSSFIPLNVFTYVAVFIKIWNKDLWQMSGPTGLWVFYFFLGFPCQIVWTGLSRMSPEEGKAGY